MGKKEEKKKSIYLTVFIFLWPELQLIHTYDLGGHGGEWLLQHVWSKPLGKAQRRTTPVPLGAICPVGALAVSQIAWVWMYCKGINHKIHFRPKKLRFFSPFF